MPVTQPVVPFIWPVNEEAGYQGTAFLAKLSKTAREILDRRFQAPAIVMLASSLAPRSIVPLAMNLLRPTTGREIVEVESVVAVVVEDAALDAAEVEVEIVGIGEVGIETKEHGGLLAFDVVQCELALAARYRTPTIWPMSCRSTLPRTSMSKPFLLSTVPLA